MLRGVEVVGSVDEWVDLLTDKSVTTDDDLRILKIVYDAKHFGVCASEIASKLGVLHHAPINSTVGRFARRVCGKTGVYPQSGSDGKPHWWRVPFSGYWGSGRFCWVMRPKLAAAFEVVFGQSGVAFVHSGEILVEDAASLVEGAVMQVSVNRYERSGYARRLCIDNYGTCCVVCGFDFERVYGEIGRDKIHMHHLVPLSEIRREYRVDPVRDLRPVCPNCHLIIHSRGEPFSIEEVREMISNSRND